VDCSKKGSDRFKSVTGRIGLDWQFTDEWMVYGSIAYGEKPGGVQLATARVIAEDGSLETRLISNSFDQEELTAYELGLKGTTWDGRLVVSTSVFYNDWKEIVLPQLLINDPVSGLPFEQPLRVNVNDADAGVLGFEIETSVGFTENFNGRFTLGWTDAELNNATQDTFALYPDYAAEGLATDGGDVSGNTLLRQPEWLLSGSLAYTHQLAGAWDWYVSGDANYQSGIYVGNDNQSWIPSHTYVNTKLGVESGVYAIEAWTRNLFDQGQAVAAYRDIYFANTDNQYAPEVNQGPRPNFDDFVPWRYTVSYPNERTYGVTFRMRFGAAVE
jgi:iron complex outermembrane receptor protein